MNSETKSKEKELSLKGKVSFLSYITLVLVPTFWGGAFIAAKMTVVELPPMTAAFLRFFIASLLLIPMMFFKEKDGRRATKEDFPWLFALGLTGIFGYNVSFFYGLKYTSAVNGSLIIASNPGITAILAVWLLKERLNLLQLFGIILSFSGVLFVISKGSFNALANLELNPGDFIFLGATLTWALYSIIGKKVMQRFSPLTATTYAVVIGSMLLFPFAIKDLMTLNWSEVSYQVWAAILYMAVFASVIAFVWWYRGVKKIGASRAAVFINLVPISAMLLATAFGESISYIEVLGAVMVIGGVFITSKK